VISFESEGSFKNTENFLLAMLKPSPAQLLEPYARAGVDALASATPLDTGETATSWGYEIKILKGSWSITWTNSHIVDGVPIAVILQYGHGTGTGGYVEGEDYINPAIKPIFDKIADEVWKAVTTA
jgi:hypothetical protein